MTVVAKGRAGPTRRFANIVTTGCASGGLAGADRGQGTDTTMKVLKQASVRAAALLLAVLMAQCLESASVAAGILQTVRDRGHVVCGVSDRLDGLSAVDQSGRWSGIEIEFCGAVAAAVFGDRTKAKFRPVSPAEGPRALSTGDIDILLGGTTWTLSREADLKMRFAGVLLHEGQGLLVPRSFGISSILELSGSSICAQRGTGAEKAVAGYFGANQMRYQLVLADRWDEVIKAYNAGTCTLLTGDLPTLAHERSRMPRPGDHVLLPELLTQEQTGPFVRQGDDPWLTVVRWTLLALIEAEQIGMTRTTLSDFTTSTDPRVLRFLGSDASLSEGLGLDPIWAQRIVTEVGSYGEIFERTLGEQSRLKLPRGANNLWDKGGLMIAPHFR